MLRTESMTSRMIQSLCLFILPQIKWPVDIECRPKKKKIFLEENCLLISGTEEEIFLVLGILLSAEHNEDGRCAMKRPKCESKPGGMPCMPIATDDALRYRLLLVYRWRSALPDTSCLLPIICRLQIHLLSAVIFYLTACNTRLQDRSGLPTL